MSESGKNLQKFKLQTAVFTAAFISLVMLISQHFNRLTWGETFLWWLISCSGAFSLIGYAFYQIEKIQTKLDDQLTRTQKYSQRQTLLASLSGGFAANLTEDEICDELVSRLAEIPEYRFVAVLLTSPLTEDRVLRGFASGEALPQAVSLPPGVGLSEIPLKTGQLLYTPDVQKSPDYFPGLGQGSELDVPIQFDDEKFGVLIIENPKVNAFSPDDFTILTTVADQAAIAILNSRLLSAEQKRRQQAEILRNATITVSSYLDLDQVLDRILHQLRDVIPYDSTCIFLREKNSVQAKAERGLSSPEEVIGHHFPADNSLFQTILQTRQPLILGNIKNDSRFQGWGGTHKMNSWMGVPLTVGSEISGFLTLEKSQLDAYDAEKAELALIFANQAAIAIQNARLFQSEKIAAEKLIILYEASQAIISASFDPERTYQTIHEAAAGLMPCEAFSITILDEKEDEIEAVYMIDREERTPPARFPNGQGLSSHIISTGDSLIVHDLQSSTKMENIPVKHFGSADHIRAFLAVPMKLGNKVIGMLAAQSYLPHKYSAEDQRFLEMLAAHAAIAIDNAKLFAQVQKLAITDSLTKVYNRRYFFDTARHEFVRSQRYQHPLTILMLDLDNYKAINDSLGHVAGDQILIQIAQFIQENIRQSDTLGRYGGDEFSILLPETDLKHATELAERLRLATEKTTFRYNDEEIKTTISIGISGTNENVTELNHLLLSADAALYEAKTCGRNCLRIENWPLTNMDDSATREWSEP